MRRPLIVKFLVLLLFVALLALSSAFVFRDLIIEDFRNLREGEMEDRVYWLTARLEASYAEQVGWKVPIVAEHVAWAPLMGMEVRLVDSDRHTVADTVRAVAALSPSSRDRVIAVSGFQPGSISGDYLPYPLFSGGEEIGRLDVRFLPPKREQLFEKRANRFLYWSALLIGGLASILGVLVARRLASPLYRLAESAEAIGRGQLDIRAPEHGNDEIGRLGQAFNRMAEKLELQEKLRRRLFANAAHELRTPLAAMRCELEGMIDNVVPVSKGQLSSLNEEVIRLSGFLQGMEDLSRAEASALSLRLQKMELRPFLEGVVERYLPLFRDQGVVLELVCTRETTVVVDPEKLLQILVNLLGNALKATASGGLVQVKGENLGATAAVTIEDNGCGMSDNELQHIFDRFYRGAQGGMGIGLAIVKELVEAHGGRIEVASRLGAGSRFTVILRSS